MMRTSLLVLLAGMALGAGCSDDREAPSSVRISPTVSRVTGLYFDKEDRIGLTISRTSGDYVTNRLMTYDGSVFTASGLKWYESTQETSTLTAYYPYSEAGVPSAFSVEADQRQGCTPSDLLGAVAREVRPGSAPVAMVFYHLMSQLSVVVENNGSSPVAAVKIGGSVVEAVVDLAVPSAKAKAGAAAVQIEAFEAEPIPVTGPCSCRSRRRWMSRWSCRTVRCAANPFPTPCSKEAGVTTCRSSSPGAALRRSR